MQITEQENIKKQVMSINTTVLTKAKQKKRERERKEQHTTSQPSTSIASCETEFMTTCRMLQGKQ